MGRCKSPDPDYEAKKAWRLANPGYNKEWRKRNKTRCRENSRQWKSDNPEKVRNNHLKRVYGITLDDYHRLLDDQNGCCAICGTDTPGGRYSTFNVDHCHSTGKVRGLLCFACNSALGKFQDNPVLLETAKQYILSSIF